MLGSDDPEILSSFAQFEKRHATLKSHHITDTFSIMDDYNEKEKTL